MGLHARDAILEFVNFGGRVMKVIARVGRLAFCGRRVVLSFQGGREMLGGAMAASRWFAQRGASSSLASVCNVDAIAQAVRRAIVEGGARATVLRAGVVIQRGARESCAWLLD